MFDDARICTDVPFDVTQKRSLAVSTNREKSAVIVYFKFFKLAVREYIACRTVSPWFQTFELRASQPHDVLQNGDGFYLTIQPYFSHYSSPSLLSIPTLRSAVHQLIFTTDVGSQILRDYHDQTHHNTLGILPKFPNRDTFAQDVHHRCHGNSH